MKQATEKTLQQPNRAARRAAASAARHKARLATTMVDGEPCSAKDEFILRLSFPEDAPLDLIIQSNRRSGKDLRHIAVLRRRLYAFGHVLPKTVDDRAVSLAEDWNLECNAKGTPEEQRVGDCIHFFKDGLFVRLRRCAKGQYPTDWIIDDVSTVDRYGCPLALLTRGFGIVRDAAERDYEG